MEPADFGHVRVPASQVTAEPGEPVDDEGGSGFSSELDGVRTDCGRLGRLTLGQTDLGEPDLIEDAAADVPFGAVLPGAQGMDLCFGSVVLPPGPVIGAQRQLDVAVGG